jgi:hypothetical protein
MDKERLEQIAHEWEQAMDFLDDVRVELEGYDGMIFLDCALEAVPELLEALGYDWLESEVESDE